MNLNNNISTLSLDAANALLGWLGSFSTPDLFLSTFIPILSWLVGRKLKRFSKPDWPLLAPVIRYSAGIFETLGFFALLFTILFCVGLLVLAEMAFIFSPAEIHLRFFQIITVGVKALWEASDHMILPLACGALLGLMISLILNVWLISRLERGAGLSDVRDLLGRFQKLNIFDPRPLIKIKKGCFIGRNEFHKPIYVPWNKLRETHVQVIGTTGSGKGVVMGLIAFQSVLAGEGLVWIDPKNDRFAPKVLAAAAKQAGKEFHFIDLNQNQPAQFNIIGGAMPYEIEELLVSGFDLIGKGTDGDYHRGKDEDAAIEASRLAIDDEGLSIADLINKCASIDSITTQDNFWRKLRKLGDLSAIKTRHGLNLKEALASRSVIYVVGSTDNERVIMLQKMLLVRINQIIKMQDRSKQILPTCMVLDEFKYLLSPVALSGLGVIRDFNTHVLLAHQSLGDLDSCAGISRAQAEGAVLDNTAIKIIYRLGDSQYAEKLSKNSGKKRTFVEQSIKHLSDEPSSNGSWREMHVSLIDEDVLMNLPMQTDRIGQASVGVLYGVHLAKLFYVGFVPVSGQAPVPKAALESPKVLNAGDLI